MPDGFSATIKGVPAAKAALDRQSALFDKAALWALRETGRVVRTAAKAKTPVYKGKGALTQKAFKADKAGAGINAPVKGLLRSSIKSTKAVKRSGGNLTLYVLPAGKRVQLYRAKIEAQAGFMEAGKAAAEASAATVWAAAIDRTLRSK